MKMQIELKKRNGGYQLTVDKPVMVCYGETIQSVFMNLRKAFVTLDKLGLLKDIK